MGMNYGLRRLAELGVKARQIRVTGGGSRSRLWRQVMADVFNAEVVTLAVGEGAAYGAALQAMWCWRKSRGEKIVISDLSDRFVKLNRRETARPRKANVAVYREIQAIQDQLSTALRPVFTRHRGWLGCE